jgi:hypothetical protein
MSAAPRQGAVARLVVALIALAIAAGTFYITSGLGLGWRIGLAVLMAAPLLLLVDLTRSAGDATPRPPPQPRSPRAD